MAVYIENLEKPKNCAVCFFNQSNCWCYINKGTIDRDDMTNLLGCPIVDVVTKETKHVGVSDE